MSGKRISNLLGKITVLFVICCFCLSTQAKYGGGTGEPNDPYLIYDANQMNAIGADANDWDKCFKLMADIDLSGYILTVFNIIGNEDNPFTGVFDGNSHTISNFNYTSTDRDFIGLFVYVSGENAEIKDIGLIDPNVAVETHAGSLVGYLVNGTITDCYVEGGRVSSDHYPGALVGQNSGSITGCYSSATVSGHIIVGGLVNTNWSKIINCHATGGVVGNSRVGGLVGQNFGTITDCYSTGNVAGESVVGCLVGTNYGTISTSFAAGDVRGKDHVIGGLVGDNRRAVLNSYATGSVSGTYDVGGLVGRNGFRDLPATICKCYASGRVSGGHQRGAGGE